MSSKSVLHWLGEGILTHRRRNKAGNVVETVKVHPGDPIPEDLPESFIKEHTKLGNIGEKVVASKPEATTADPELKKRIAELEQQLKDFEAGTDDELNAKVEELEKQATELESKVSDLVKENEEFTAKNESLTKANEDLTKENSELKKQVEELEAAATDPGKDPVADDGAGNGGAGPQ